MKNILNIKTQSNVYNQNKKHGVYSLAMAALVIGIIIIVNLMAKQLNFSIDLTEDKVFSLSDQSSQIISNLTEKVEIIALHKSGSEETTITRILNEYKKNSDAVTINYIDPELHPNVVSKYQKAGSSLSYGSIIVTNGEKYKTIDAEDMYTFDKDFKKIESVQAESKITNSILYVVNDYDSVVYSVVGHDEEPLPSSMKSALANENYKIKDLQLLQGGWEPKDHDIVILNGPKKDLTDSELESLTTYLNNGGSVFILVDLIDKNLPNLDSLLNSFGVDVKDAMVFENNKSYTVTTQNFYLLPKLVEHSIVDPLRFSKSAIMSVYAQPIETLKVKKDTLKIESLAVTSKDSYAKAIEQMKNTSTQEKEDIDLEGPFDIAVAITEEKDKKNPDLNGQMVLFFKLIFIKG